MTPYPYDDVIRLDILRMIPDDGSVIGSIGCGSAATEAELVTQGRQVHGVDVASEALEVAKPRLTSATLIAPGEPLPFELASLDGLILADVIEHLPQAWDQLKYFSTFLKPGGWVVISVPNMRSLQVLQEFLWNGDWPEDSIGIFDRTHLQVMSKKRLARWCDAAGLEVDQWFDRYDPRYPRWQKQIGMLDRLTLKIFHNLMMYQVQVRCRRRK